MIKYFHQYYPLRKFLYVIIEGGLIFGCLFLLSIFFETHVSSQAQSANPNVGNVSIVTFVVILSLYYHDLYEFKSRESLKKLLYKIGHALSVSCVIVGLLYFLFPQIALNTGLFFFALFVLLFILVSWRLGYQYLCQKGYFKEKIFLVGSGPLALSIIDAVCQNLDSGISIVTVYSNPHAAEVAAEYGLDENKDYSVLCDNAVRYGIKKVVLALEERRGAVPLQELLDCRMKGIKILEGVYFYELLTGKIVATQTPPSWLIFSEGFNRQVITLMAKRGLDIFFSLTALIGLSPAFAIIALAIKADSSGPALFRQIRVGQWAHNFELIKFRTMREAAEEGSGAVWAQSDDDRITKVGRFLRKVRLDELPQFWNILKGDMSFIGPRPERPEFVSILQERLPYYGERHTIKPGLSGWAQVNYGYGASEEDALRKLEYDLFYIKHLSVIFDLYIVFKTIKIVIFGKGR